MGLNEYNKLSLENKYKYLCDSRGYLEQDKLIKLFCLLENDFKTAEKWIVNYIKNDETV